jgi:hypothetical protein
MDHRMNAEERAKLPLAHHRGARAGIVVMRVDPVIPRCENCTLVVEAIGDDKVRVNHQSLPSSLVILADQALEIIAAGKSLHIARAVEP